MRPISYRALSFATPLLVCAAAFGQPVTGQERPAPPPLEEIERGFFIGVDAGVNFVINPPANAGPRPFSTGQVIRLELGYDLGERVSLSAFVIGAANRASSEYIGVSGGTASGDFWMLTPGASVRVNAVGFADAQDVQRTWLYARLGVGYSFFSPSELVPRDVLVFVGPGVEYYTRLRHFSIGVEVTGSMLVSSGAFGFAVTPHLRYAF
ncbi:MAG: adventurous gliding motility protein CglE [Myxococcaceae bacterium]